MQLRNKLSSKMKFQLKQSRFYKLLVILTATILVFTFSSCCNKDNFKESSNNNKANYWEHFIAHGGGAIDGKNYTNCLEALDLSYSKGCRMFELDFGITTDGKIVVNYGAPRMTEEEFMNRRIRGKFTPMNMETLNDWFQKHPDAILVTDKLNEPQRMYDEFTFRDRLIMELFTWEAIDKANELGIKPMVTEKLIFTTSNIEQVLKEKKIEYICMSRYYNIKGNENLLRNLKKNGIKNYVYHLELPLPYSELSAEEYVWNYEMDFCYGMYANDLDFLSSLLNENNEKK
jgi:hypothetical protein